tara:strand:+ start:452 stop:1324 length:873 start_codon:yes stop_codon:yes gene_type:complete
MLGLGISMSHGATSGYLSNVNEIAGYALHYDASSASNLQTFGGSAPSNGDEVAFITNLAHAVSGVNAFGTGSIEGQGRASWNSDGYLDFSGDANNYYQSSDNLSTTRVSVGNWSESDAVSTEISIFIVYKPEAANDTEAQVLLQLNGNEIGEVGGRYMQVKNDIGDDPDHKAVTVYNKGSSGNVDTASDIYDESAAVTLFSMVGKSGANTMIYKNGDTSDGVTNFDQDTQNWDMSDAGLCLGARSSSPIVAAIDSYFMGRIYEVLIYNQDLNEESRVFIDNYLINKYSIS